MRTNVERRPQGLHYIIGILLFLVAAPAAAQLPQPTVVPPPSAPDFLTHYDFHLAAAALSVDDQRFSWDTRFGGDVDLVDYVVGRAGIRVDYEAVLGSEYRPFDANQGNYTLEANASARLGANTEVVGIFHHVSRHLSDRPKREAIAWNETGLRLLQRAKLGGTTIDADLEGGYDFQHSFVDYTWIGELGLVIRHPVSPRLAVFAQGWGQAIGVDQAMYGRSAQTGGVGEAGLRFDGRRGALELFAGYEKRVDAYPTVLGSKQWTLAGFRFLSR